MENTEPVPLDEVEARNESIDSETETDRLCSFCGNRFPNSLYSLHVIDCIANANRLIPISFVCDIHQTNDNVHAENEIVETSLRSNLHPFTSPTEIRQLLDILMNWPIQSTTPYQNNILLPTQSETPSNNADEETLPLFWLHFSTIPSYGLGYNWTIDDEYEYNTMIGDMLGKVEVGFTPSEIDRISHIVDKNTLCESDRCPICLETFTELDDDVHVRKLKCSHVYCNNCILTWLEKHKKCPCCQIDLEDTYMKNEVKIEN